MSAPGARARPFPGRLIRGVRNAGGRSARAGLLRRIPSGRKCRRGPATGRRQFALGTARRSVPFVRCPGCRGQAPGPRERKARPRWARGDGRRLPFVRRCHEMGETRRLHRICSGSRRTRLDSGASRHRSKKCRRGPVTGHRQFALRTARRSVPFVRRPGCRGQAPGPRERKARPHRARGDGRRLPFVRRSHEMGETRRLRRICSGSRRTRLDSGASRHRSKKCRHGALCAGSQRTCGQWIGAGGGSAAGIHRK